VRGYTLSFLYCIQGEKSALSDVFHVFVASCFITFFMVDITHRIMHQVRIECSLIVTEIYLTIRK
jgi:hypothetical protein